jgi:hypothetical protein
MAKTTKIAPSKKLVKPKPITKGPAKAALNVIDFIVPKTKTDVALTVFPYAKVARSVGGIVGKGAKKVSKLYRNMGR